jgi:hypothetical protein
MIVLAYDLLQSVYHFFLVSLEVVLGVLGVSLLIVHLVKSDLVHHQTVGEWHFHLKSCQYYQRHCNLGDVLIDLDAQHNEHDY